MKTRFCRRQEAEEASAQRENREGGEVEINVSVETHKGNRGKTRAEREGVVS